MQNNKEFVYFIFQKDCFRQFTQLAFNNIDCLSITLSKIMSLLIVSLSIITKIPQIIKIVRKGSGFGISFMGVAIQMLMNVANISYGLNTNKPFSLYGQNLFLGLQNLVILVILCYYNKKSSEYFFFLAQLGFSAYLLVPGLAPQQILQNTVILNIVLIVLARGLQIIQNCRNSSTGNLTLVQFLLSFMGNVARAGTIFKQSKDFLFLLSALVPMVLNGFICLQFIQYWNKQVATEPAGKPVQKKKKKS